LAVWCVQSVGREVRLIRYLQGTGGETIPDMAKHLSRLPYVYSVHLMPHDAAATELGTGRSRQEQAEALGLRPIRIVSRLSVDDGIAAGRALFARCWFDEDSCRQGLDALGFYHKSWDPRGQCYRNEPAHDWSSHAADAFRTGAVGTRGGEDLTPREIKVETEFELGGRIFGARER